MKYINKRRRQKRIRNRLLIILLFIIIFGALFLLYLQNKPSVTYYENEHYKGKLYQMPLSVDSLCVASDNVTWDGFSPEDELHAAALFQLNENDVVYAKDIHERIYPASTTKILTAYLALKYGELTDIITIGENAVGVPLDSSRAGLRQGDQVSLEVLLYGLMLPSGNDSAVAIAASISGSEEAFAELMNQEAAKIGATNSNFINAHGYHDENHYTTAYDLYLIFNECVKYDKFLEIISSSQYETRITQKNGTYREVLWRQSNQYINGGRQTPNGLIVVGGKTGTTDEAGACLILYSKEGENNSYISIIMGADNKGILYDNMSELITSIPRNK